MVHCVRRVLTCILCFIAFSKCGRSESFSRTGITGEPIELICWFTNSTTSVSWTILPQKTETPLTITTCNISTKICGDPDQSIFVGTPYKAEVTQTYSNLLITVPKPIESVFSCESGNTSIPFNVRIIDRSDIRTPNCTVRPFAGRTKMVEYLCEVEPPSKVPSELEIISDWGTISGSPKRVNISVDSESFLKDGIVSCRSSIPELNEVRSCVFPGGLFVNHIITGSDAKFFLQTEADTSGGEIEWRLLDNENKALYIKNRSWIQDDGKSMLLREITEYDTGEVVECRVHTDSSLTNLDSVGFAELIEPVDNGSTDENESNNGRGSNDVFKALFGLFFVLWISSLFVVAWLVYQKTKKRSSK